MVDAGRLVDSLGIFLTGGSSQTNPDLSLGGLRSTTGLHRGLGAIVRYPTIPALRIDNVHPACGEGTATITINASGALIFTPPGGSPGDPVTIAAGETKVLTGADTNKAIRVFRHATLPLTGIMTLTLVNPLNGVLGQGNISSAQRVSGLTTYRALSLAPRGTYGVINIRLWFPVIGGNQSTLSIGIETPVAGSIQTIADEFTAPTGIVWSSPTSEGSALLIPGIGVGLSMGVWIRRVFPPAGTVDPRENVQLAKKYRGA